MHPHHHALSSVKHFGGTIEDYLPIHNWFDATKESFPDFRHRALRHHAEGIFECERLFGITIRNTDGKHVPVRTIAEMHVIEDCGKIPTIAEWLSRIHPEPWMQRATKIGALSQRTAP